MLIATSAALCLECMKIFTNLPTLQCPSCGSIRLHYHLADRGGVKVWKNTDNPELEYWAINRFPVVVLEAGTAGVGERVCGG